VGQRGPEDETDERDGDGGENEHAGVFCRRGATAGEAVNVGKRWGYREGAWKRRRVVVSECVAEPELG
jgi:hypothetical protein